MGTIPKRCESCSGWTITCVVRNAPQGSAVVQHAGGNALNLKFKLTVSSGFRPFCHANVLICMVSKLTQCDTGGAGSKAGFIPAGSPLLHTTPLQPRCAQPTMVEPLLPCITDVCAAVWHQNLIIVSQVALAVKLGYPCWPCRPSMARHSTLMSIAWSCGGTQNMHPHTTRIGHVPKLSCRVTGRAGSEAGAPPAGPPPQHSPPF